MNHFLDYTCSEKKKKENEKPVSVRPTPLMLYRKFAQKLYKLKTCETSVLEFLRIISCKTFFRGRGFFPTGSNESGNCRCRWRPFVCKDILILRFGNQGQIPVFFDHNIDYSPGKWYAKISDAKYVKLEKKRKQNKEQNARLNVHPNGFFILKDFFYRHPQKFEL